MQRTSRTSKKAAATGGEVAVQWLSTTFEPSPALDPYCMLLPEDRDRRKLELFVTSWYNVKRFFLFMTPIDARFGTACLGGSLALNSVFCRQPTAAEFAYIVRHTGYSVASDTTETVRALINGRAVIEANNPVIDDVHGIMWSVPSASRAEPVASLPRTLKGLKKENAHQNRHVDAYRRTHDVSLLPFLSFTLYKGKSEKEIVDMVKRAIDKHAHFNKVGIGAGGANGVKGSTYNVERPTDRVRQILEVLQHLSEQVAITLMRARKRKQAQLGQDTSALTDARAVELVNYPQTAKDADDAAFIEAAVKRMHNLRGANLGGALGDRGLTTAFLMWEFGWRGSWTTIWELNGDRSRFLRALRDKLAGQGQVWPHRVGIAMGGDFRDPRAVRGQDFIYGDWRCVPAAVCCEGNLTIARYGGSMPDNN